MNLQKMHDSLDAYLATVKIETDQEPRAFSEVADPFQREDIAAIAPAIEHLTREDAPLPPVRRAWWVRPRGHAKTADAAMLVARVIAFSRRRRRGVWVAADKDQGCEGLDSIRTLCRHNPWLDAILTIQGDKIINRRTDSIIHFTTSDVLSAYGWKDCDLFIMDEVTHWPLKGEDLWTAMYSASGKRAGAVVFALMNAGHAETFQRRLRDIAETDSNWAFSELPDAIATWISIEQLKDQHRYLPAVGFDRLWRNQWAPAGGDALTPEDIARAFDDRMKPMTGNESDYLFVGGLDLGLVRDFSSFVVLGVPKGGGAGHIRLAAHRLWRPPPGGKISLPDVQRHTLEMDKKFNLQFVGYDPWQAENMAQLVEADTGHVRRNRLRKFHSKPFMRELFPTSTNLRAQASLTIEGFHDGRFTFFSCEPLRKDFLRLRCEEKSYGFRLVSPKDAATGHGDSYSAWANAMLIGNELAIKKPIKIGAWTDTSPISGNRLSPMERAYRQIDRENERRREEESQPDDNQDDWRRTMRLIGRL